MQRLGSCFEEYKRPCRAFEMDTASIFSQLQRLHKTIDEKHDLETKLFSKSQQIMELQDSLSEMELFMCKERDRVRELCAENDTLKMREVELEDEVDRLRQMVPQHSRAASTSNPSTARSTSRGARGAAAAAGAVVETAAAHERENQRLRLEISTLRAQVEQLMGAGREQLNIVQSENDLTRQEVRVARNKDALLLDSLRERLKHTERLLFDTAAALVEQQRAHEEARAAWEEERAFLEAKGASQQPPPVGGAPARTKATQALSERVQKASQLRDMYRGRCVELEKQLSSTKDELISSKKTVKDLRARLTRETSLLRTQVERARERRHLDVEGQRSDVRLMQDRVHELEKQLAQLVVVMSDDREKDVLAQDAHKKTVYANLLLNEMLKVKSKIRSIERDIFHSR